MSVWEGLLKRNCTHVNRVTLAEFLFGDRRKSMDVKVELQKIIPYNEHTSFCLRNRLQCGLFALAVDSSSTSVVQRVLFSTPLQSLHHLRNRCIFPGNKPIRRNVSACFANQPQVECQVVNTRNLSA